MYLSGLVRHLHPQNGIKNNDQDQNEPAASCHISKLVNDMSSFTLRHIQKLGTYIVYIPIYGQAININRLNF